MLKSQKHLVRASEIKGKLNELANADTLTPEQTADVDRLRNELGSVEAQYRAAATFEDSFNGDDKPEHREFAELEQRASLSGIFEVALQHRVTSGAEHELQAALGIVDSNRIPLALLRTRAVTPAPTNVGQTQAAIIPAVFPDSVAAFLSVDVVTVPVGDATFPVLTGSATAQTPAQDTATNPTEDTGAFDAEVLSPARLQTSFLYSRESAARFSGLDSALRANLSDAISDGLDDQILTGTNGLFTASILTAHDVTAQDDFEGYLSRFGWARVDGRFASSVGDLVIVMGSATYAHAGTQYSGTATNKGDLSAVEKLMDITGGVRVSSHVPAVASSKQNAVIRLGVRRDAVAALWEGPQIIMDEVTKSAEGQIRLTIVALHAVKILRTDGFYLQQTQHA